MLQYIIKIPGTTHILYPDIIKRDILKMQKILIVEDDIIICSGIKIFLENKGYTADCAYSVSEAEKALKTQYSLILLDINLPDENGISFLTRFRRENTTPVIFLTANDTEKDMIEGFKCGCDDYIAKPFSVELLYQRISAVLRRSSAVSDADTFSYKDLSVDFKKMQVKLSGKPIKLSATEFKLLTILIKNKGQVITRDIILEKIWDCDENYIDENTLNVHIGRLRKKLNRTLKILNI